MSDDLKTNYTKLNKKYQELQKQLKDTENLAYELQTKLNLKEYEPVFCNLAGRVCAHLGEVEVLKQQLSLKKMGESWEKEKKIKALEEVSKLKQQLAEKDKEIAELKSKLAVGDFWHSAYQGKQNDYDLLYSDYRKLLGQLHTQPKEIVEKIREPINQLEYGILKRYKEETVVSEWDSMKLECYDQTLKILEEILKEYEEKGDERN